MRAVVIGAGRIGCGFVGQMLHRSGHEVCLVGRGPVVDHLTRANGYVVRVTDGRTVYDQPVDGIRVLDAGATAEIEAEIAGSELVCTAVGPGALDTAAATLARGLAAARHPVNVIAFENAEDAGPRLRRLVAAQAGIDTAVRHGFSGAVVNRVVAHRLLPQHPTDPVVLVGEPHTEFAVDIGALKQPVAMIEGLVPVRDFAGYYRRKLFRYSAGHAAAAYLGHVKGYRLVHAAVRDPEIRAAVRGAMTEGRLGLDAKYSSSVAGTEDELDEILRRFDNAALGDTVARVGRDACRKLAPHERLIGPARLAEDAGIPPVWLAQAAAAALCFAGAPIATPAYRRALLREVAGLAPDASLARRIETAWLTMFDGWQDGNLLLSLKDQLWSWSSRPRVEELAGAS